MMTNSAIVRNHGLDFLKGILACVIVFTHAPFPKPFGLYVAYFGTISVSVFFMVAGYFSLGASNRKLRHSIKRTFIYLLVAEVLYLFKKLIAGGFDFQALFNFLDTEVFTLEHMAKLLVISQSKICFLAWFLISLLMCYVLKLLLGRHLRVLGYLGMAVGIVVSLPPIDNQMDFPVSNPWLWGIPFFTLGECLREHETELLKRIGRKGLVGCCLLGIAIIIISRYYGTQWWFIGNYVLAPALFLLFADSDMKKNWFCLLGSTYVFFIFIVHPLVLYAYHVFRHNPSTGEMWLRPLIVLAMTIALAVVYYGLKGWLRNTIRRQPEL